MHVRGINNAQRTHATYERVVPRPNLADPRYGEYVGRVLVEQRV